MKSEASRRPRGCTNFKLRQLTRRVSHHYDVELAKAGLKTTQYSLLSHVVKLGPIAPGVLAREMTMDASTLTRNLKPLISAGWVRMRPGENGRTRSVGITEAGRRMYEQAGVRWRVAQEGINDLIGVGRVASLHAMLDEALALLDSDDDEPRDA